MTAAGRRLASCRSRVPVSSTAAPSTPPRAATTARSTGRRRGAGPASSSPDPAWSAAARVRRAGQEPLREVPPGARTREAPRHDDRLATSSEGRPRTRPVEVRGVRPQHRPAEEGRLDACTTSTAAACWPRSTTSRRSPITVSMTECNRDAASGFDWTASSLSVVYQRRAAPRTSSTEIGSSTARWAASRTMMARGTPSAARTSSSKAFRCVKAARWNTSASAGGSSPSSSIWARTWFPDYPGEVPAGAYPAGWVPARDA